MVWGRTEHCDESAYPPLILLINVREPDQYPDILPPAPYLGRKMSVLFVRLEQVLYGPTWTVPPSTAYEPYYPRVNVLTEGVG
jgi:hypothetical protein